MFRSAFICLLSLLAFSTHASTRLTLTTWCPPPFSTIDQNGSFDLLLKQAFAQLDIEITIIQKPAERSLKDANSGKTDGEFIRVADIGRLYPNLLKVPEPLYLMEFVAFTKNKDLKISTDWGSLTKHSIGYVIGWKIIEENTLDLPFKVGISDQKKLFQLLDANRFELALYSRGFGQQIINELALKGIYAVGEPFAVEPMYLFVHKRHKNIIPKLSKILKALKSDALKEK